MPRRQEAPDDAFVSEEMLNSWITGPHVLHARIIAVSHVWEAREHPDPWSFQLEKLREACTSNLQTTYWLFYDFMSLHQYKRKKKQQVRFQKAMEKMFLVYAHEHTSTWRLEQLTPDEWRQQREREAGVKLQIYYEPSSRVEARSLRDLSMNRTEYAHRGWCTAEKLWSNTREEQGALDFAELLRCLGSRPSGH